MLRAVISNSSKAMGADNLKTIEFSATGWEYTFGQAVNPNSPWPGYEYRNYTRATDFETRAWRIDRVLADVPPNRRGGGLLPALTQTVAVNPNTPWAQQLEIWTTPHGFLKAAAANSATVSRRRLEARNTTL